MSKKEKSFILIGIIVLIMLLMFGIYIQSSNKTNIGNQKINISIDDSKLNEINLDGANSQINQNELNGEYLESIQISMFSFFEKTIEKIN